MKTSRMMVRAALPLLAVFGFTSISSDANAIGGGKRIFKFVEVTSDLTPGYTRDSYKFECNTDRVWFDSAGNPVQNGFPLQEEVHTKRNMSHLRSVTTFDAYEGPLIYSFMEVMAGIATSTDEKTVYNAKVDRNLYRIRYGFDPQNHTISGAEGSTGHRKASDNWDGHIIVGYDLSKTREGNKAASFKPFAGYFWTHASSTRQTVDGKFLTADPALGATVFDGRSYVEAEPFWHGMMMGGLMEVSWPRGFLGDILQKSVWVRGDVRICRSRVHQLTLKTESRTPTIFPLNDEVKIKFARDKQISTWRFLGYSLSAGFKKKIFRDWTFFSDVWFMHMRDKRYSDKTFQTDVNGQILLKNRIEKLWHRRVDIHAGVAFSY